jgi:hypothetical protein
MTEDLKVDIDPGGPEGNGGRGPTVVIAVLSIAIVAALVFVGVAVVLRFVNGPEAEPTAAATPEPTATVVAETTVQPSSTPTAGPTATGTQPAATVVDRTPTSAAGTTAAPATETPATETPATDTPPTEPTATPRPPGKPATMASPDYGIQAFLWWRPEVAHRDLGLIRDAGFTWVKQWFAWRDIEGAGQGEYDWETADRIVDQVEEFGLKLIVRVDHGPQWAGPPPSNSDHFARFMTTLATRYKGRIHAYQVWNEPNLAREWGNRPPNAREYTQMLTKAYNAIKGADPNALVVTAGMAPTTERSQRAVPDTQFIQAMYDAGAKPYFDLLGAHGAGYRAPPELDPAVVATDANYYNVGDPNCPGDACRIYCFRHVEDLRQIMVNNGDAAKRVVVLEFGWTIDERPDSPYYWHRVADQFVQGEYMVRAYRYAKENWQPWIGIMSLIYMPDAKWTQNDEQYWWSVMEPSPVDQLYLKAPYVMLCDYIRTERGLDRCPYLPEG